LLIENRAVYIYYADISEILNNELRPNVSKEVYLKWEYVIQERLDHINTMKKSRISDGAFMLGPAYEALDNALQSRASEVVVHSAMSDFANAVQKAQSAFGISSPIESDSAHKMAPAASGR
jgi:hypothetical protein